MNFIMDKLVGPIVDLFSSYLLKHVRYTFEAGDNVELLRRKAEVFKGKYDTVKNDVEVKERGTSMKRTQEVQGWLVRADDLLREAREIKVVYEKRNCMVGFRCSLNCCSNHSISTKAIKLTSRIENELTFINETNVFVADVTPPNVQEENTAMVLVSNQGGQLEAMLKKAISFIDVGDKGVLGIWGMGGVGKTTLLKQINNSLMSNTTLQVMFVVASLGCTPEKLQRLIVDRLGLKKEGADLSRTIFEFLKDKNFVLLLDDVWEYLNLESVGIPIPLGIFNGYKRKVILTSRSRRICYNMGTNDNVMNVECLKWDEAWTLFRKNVGEGTLSTSNPQILELAEKVARECKGHPLALITIGQAMAQQDSVEIWKNTFYKLSTSQMSEIVDDQLAVKDPNSVLKVSYDNLRTDRLKKCFLHCALWPEDYSIKKDELIESWMGHGMIVDTFDNFGDVYRQGHVIIDTLVKVCLLEKVEDDDSVVKMHDLVRDMALWVARDCGAKKKRWVVVSGNITEEATEETEMVSKTEAEKDVMNSSIHDWPHLTTFIERQPFSDIPSKDLSNIQYYRNLKYLEVSGDGADDDLLTNICRLENLEYLRLTKFFLRAKELKNLKNLKFLILRNVFCGPIPLETLKSLKKLLVLDVFKNQMDYCNVTECLEDMRSWPLKALGLSLDAMHLRKLTKLSSIIITRLSIHDIFGWPSINLLSDEFLGRPHMHSDLKELRLCESTDMTNLVFDGAGCCMAIEKLKLHTLYNLEEIIWRGVQPQDVFPKLRKINIYDCNHVKKLSWVALLPRLKHLEVENCEDLVCILDEQDAVPVTFPRLTELYLIDLPNLKSISESVLPSLRTLFVENCEELKKLPLAPLRLLAN